MNSPSSTNTAQLASQLMRHRRLIVDNIRAHLHGSDDPNKLSLTNHLEEVGDWVGADLLDDTNIAILGSEVSELGEIDAALLSIKAGTYGICTDCSETIPAQRMMAQPTAQRCLACQTAADKRRGTGHSATL